MISMTTGRFTAMASPCEVIVDSDDPEATETALRIAREEALRVEAKFSRYRDDNIVHRINVSSGDPVEVDRETAGLLDYAAACHRLSEGRFDITSGALRRVWSFDGSDRVPSDDAVRGALRFVGWHRVSWSDGVLAMEPGMEIDLGGIGKEYAVDRAAALIGAAIEDAFLVSFGGDLVARGPRRGGAPWAAGIDDPAHPGARVLYKLEIDRGGLATSGDARRYVLHRGKRLSHILDARTGWPVEDAPRSVTVLASTCLEAGTLSTLACMRGAAARAFLEEQGASFWIL